MQYEGIRYLPEEQDPSVTIETRDLVVKVIDNTGLLVQEKPGIQSFFGRYHLHSFSPLVHHLGYHGIRTFYHKEERRNLVVMLASWLNLQGASLAGIEFDPLDERAWAGVGRGWPVRLERRDKGAALVLDPMPKMQMGYAVEFQPAEPDGIDFALRFTFGRKPEGGPARFQASWPCYMNAWDDVRLFYPRGTPEAFAWIGLGEKPNIVLGETVHYTHEQQRFSATEQAFPLAYGRLGNYALSLMMSDPRVRFFVINGGGHQSLSPVQNPAWDFEWSLEDYPLGEPVGFQGRLIYARWEGEETILARYRQWTEGVGSA